MLSSFARAPRSRNLPRRRRWAKALVVLYPCATLFCIIVTANHFWLDAAIGLLTLATGFAIGTRIADFWKRREKTASIPVGQ